ncbi:hypothetical protein SAMN05414137_16411, partial [Streptacidiphilus jiangxiensis]
MALLRWILHVSTLILGGLLGDHYDDAPG